MLNGLNHDDDIEVLVRERIVSKLTFMHREPTINTETDGVRRVLGAERVPTGVLRRFEQEPTSRSYIEQSVVLSIQRKRSDQLRQAMTGRF
jgi:hypothetical protein